MQTIEIEWEATGRRRKHKGCNPKLRMGNRLSGKAIYGAALESAKTKNIHTTLARQVNHDTELLADATLLRTLFDWVEFYVAVKPVAQPGMLRNDNKPVSGKPALTNSFFNMLVCRTFKGERDRALDELYDVVRGTLRAGDFEYVDEFLRTIPVTQVPLHLMLGVLTSTLPAKSRLPARQEYKEKVRKELESRQIYRDSLLSGL